MPPSIRRRLRRLTWQHLTVAAVVVAFGATMIGSATGPSDSSAPDPPAPPVVPATPVAVPPDTPVAVTPGCRSDAPAPRAGGLPPTGRPVVAGVRLPQGSRCGTFWSTDGGVPDAAALAGQLARVFPQTGLWPLLWISPDEEPDGYVVGEGATPSHAGAEALLRGSWEQGIDEHLGDFPGLAARAEPTDARFDAFASAGSTAYRPAPGGWVVMLVSVRRPADVLRTLGMEITEHFSDAGLSTVLASWAERFGAVPVALAPGQLEVAVAAPPADEQLERLAAEHLAFAPEQEVESLEEIARALRGARTWAFGWPD